MHRSLEFCKFSFRYGIDLIKVLEVALFRFFNEEVDKNERKDVEARKQAQRATTAAWVSA